MLFFQGLDRGGVLFHFSKILEVRERVEGSVEITSLMQLAINLHHFHNKYK